MGSTDKYSLSPSQMAFVYVFISLQVCLCLVFKLILSLWSYDFWSNSISLHSAIGLFFCNFGRLNADPEVQYGRKWVLMCWSNVPCIYILPNLYFIEKEYTIYSMFYHLQNNFRSLLSEFTINHKHWFVGVFVIFT